MAEKDLTASRLRELISYNSETGLLTWCVNRGGSAKTGVVSGRTHASGYVQISIDGHRYMAHRLAWLYMTGEWPVDQVDHKNGARSDNRWDNLRQATRAQNQQNQRKARIDNGCGFLGVTPNGSHWQARIRIGGKLKCLGTFATPEIAHAAYLEAKARFHPFQTIVDVTNHL